MRQRDPALTTDQLGRPDLAPWLPQPALSPVDYARGHALFEARSDQRGRVVAWLDGRLAAHPAPSVLAVGCGSGAVDGPLAESACTRAGSASLSWTGVDPHGPSARAFVATLDGLGHPGLHATSHACTFEELPDLAPVDVVTFVHSLYYVRDVREALQRSVALLRPGGELLLLHAPLGALNELVAAVAPPADGHPQWWSDTVRSELRRLPVSVEIEDLSAVVDLTGCELGDRALLDFTVQAELTDDVRPVVLEHLRRAALPGPGLRLPHPVTAFAVRRD